jgi:hypothetical protein
MKLKLIFFFLFCYVVASTAQTNIPAGNVSGNWTKAGSPYKVQGEITVAKGSTLSLEPGTIVEFQKNNGMIVDGILNANGKKGDSITFRAASGFVWSGITFYRNTQIDTIRFNFCKWENVAEKWLSYHGKYPFEWRPLNVLLSRNIFCAYSSPLVIKNCSFYFNVAKKKQANLIYAFKTTLIIDSVFITSASDTISNSSGLIGCDSSEFYSIDHVKAMNIKYFNFLFIASENIALITKPSMVRRISALDCPKMFMVALRNCRNNMVDDVSGDNIRIGANLTNSNNCVIKNVNIKNSETAFTSSGNCVGSIVENCVFEKCGIITQVPSLEIYSSGPLFKNCSFNDSKCGINISQNYGPGTPLFLNCNFDGSLSSAAGIEGYPAFINCNFTNNSDIRNNYTGAENIPYMGGVVVSREFNNSRPYFFNCLFWNNRDSFGHHNSIVLMGKVVKVDLINCLIEGDSSEGIKGYDDDLYKDMRIPAGNLSYSKSNGRSPGFVDSATKDYSLLNTCSNTAYAINKGMSGDLLSQYPFTILLSQYGVNIYETTDLAGNPRVMDDTLDIGCYESSGTKRALKLRSKYNDTTLCYGGSSSYGVKAYGTVQSYQWQKKTGNTISNINNTKSLALEDMRESYAYRLMVSNNECLPLKDSSRWFDVSINSPLKKGILISPDKDTFQMKDSIVLSTMTSGYQTYTWSKGKTTGSIRYKGSDLGAKGPHIITLAARKDDGCLETDTITIYTIDNLQSIFSYHKNKRQVILYPQPASGMISIKGENVRSIRIMSLDGKLLKDEQIIATSNATLDVAGLSPGTYLMEMTDHSGNIRVIKWVKE